ncbi:E3 ubiquitin/ISG15 ligase TRIM25-like isoform X3 [Trematomus bernacchii]|uniref:E3 ubiquitin/ISG15 ligase TRIM25-like isoform X3 n=1 Tax=Trematomus bernacchii TaxID=40690 RepID=UPI001469FC44|nr:E3 ubiquitin/ISG15 ligase TRIM25-like isoform X3 [Trematomus bernacchii]
MAAANYVPSEDRFLCSICLDVFTDPVTTSCGHNFCKDCITEHWDISDRCQCPMCKEAFNTRPDLRVNTFISEMVAQFRQSAQQKASSSSSSSSSKQQVFKPGEVPCDVCTETKLKALKSCLVCLTSYCETHLEPHLTASSLKRHQLIDPVENLEDRMCPKHDKPLELFCKTDQTCVCMLCHVSDHKMHDVVPLKEGYEGEKAELETEIQQMIQKRQLKVEEIKHSVDLSKEEADREVAEGVQVFTALKESVERGQANLINTIKEKQKTTENQAEDLIKELEQEISELKKRSSEVEQVTDSEDHLDLLQRFMSLKVAPPTKDWTEVSIHSSHEGTVVRAVLQLEETFSKEMKKLIEGELKRVQKYAVDVTPDPDTAHPNLILSGGGKQENAPLETAAVPADDTEDAAAAAPKKKKKGLGSFFKATVDQAAEPQPALEKDKAIALELQSYLQAVPLDAEEDPLKWWRESRKFYPRLSILARKYLCIPATSSSSERVFSTGGNIVTCLRSSLKPDHVNRLVFLAKNL